MSLVITMITSLQPFSSIYRRHEPTVLPSLHLFVNESIETSILYSYTERSPNLFPVFFVSASLTEEPKTKTFAYLRTGKEILTLCVPSIPTS